MPDGRVALVTGGTRGIGEAIARRLAQDGFAVFISGRTEESTRAALARFAQAKLPVPIKGFAADARREADQKRLVESTAREGGRLDVLVNNAGLGHFGPVDSLEPEQFREVIETNLLGVHYAVHFAAPLMKKNGRLHRQHRLARGVNAFAGGSAYNASKFGLLGFSEAAMLDLRHSGIRMASVLARLGRHGVRAPQPEPRKLMDAPPGGRGRGGLGSGALSGTRHRVAHRPETVQASEEVRSSCHPEARGAEGPLSQPCHDSKGVPRYARDDSAERYSPRFRGGLDGVFIRSHRAAATRAQRS